MKRIAAKYREIICFFICVAVAVAACRGDVTDTSADSSTHSAAETIEAAGSTESHAVPVIPSPSNRVKGLSTSGASDPISVRSQKYPVPPTYNEVPFFADLVAAGKLPPISERLPLEPFVVGPGVLNSERLA